MLILCTIYIRLFSLNLLTVWCGYHQLFCFDFFFKRCSLIKESDISQLACKIRKKVSKSKIKKIMVKLNTFLRNILNPLLSALYFGNVKIEKKCRKSFALSSELNMKLQSHKDSKIFVMFTLSLLLFISCKMFGSISLQTF